MSVMRSRKYEASPRPVPFQHDCGREPAGVVNKHRLSAANRRRAWSKSTADVDPEIATFSIVR